MDQVGNFRESVWSVNGPLEEQVSPVLSILWQSTPPYQTLGSLSSANSSFVYDVAGRNKLKNNAGLDFTDGTSDISVEFAFLQNQVW